MAKQETLYYEFNGYYHKGWLNRRPYYYEFNGYYYKGWLNRRPYIMNSMVTIIKDG